METVSSPDPLRWGVLGAARIAGKVVPAIRAAGGEVVALAASRRERAEQAGRGLGIARTYEGYARLLEDEEVEAVYLPLANGLHHEWLLATADAGKACLCEKPLVLSAAEAVEVRDRFRRAGRRLQEAFMWRHHPQADWLAEQLVPGRLGEPLRFHATFSFRLDRPHDYRWSRAMGGGAIADIGCYGINAARRFFAREPLAVSFRARFGTGDDGVDESAAGWLDFGDGRLATVSCSFRSAFAQGIEVVGDEGRARVDRPWLSVGTPTEIVTERANQPETRRFEAVNAFEAMVCHFTRTVRDPALARQPAEDGVAQAAVLEAALASARDGGAAQPVRGEAG